MAEKGHASLAKCPRAIIATICLVPWALAMATQASAQPNSQQMEQQRRAQAEARRALEESERRIAEVPGGANQGGAGTIGAATPRLCRSGSQTGDRAALRGISRPNPRPRLTIQSATVSG
jgi:hypothetical protein